LLKLNRRELPTVTFRRVLPEYLGPGGECFFAADARAGGAANPAYLGATERAMLVAAVKDLRLKAVITDEAEISEKSADILRDTFRARLGAMYDVCVIEWQSNIMDGDGPIICNRENFMALLDAHVPEIGQALLELEAEVLAAGNAILSETKATIKN